MRLLTSLVLMILAPAMAAPLLTTKSSVAEGNFCKTYKCVLTDRSVVLPETMATLSYVYKVTGGVLAIGRESNMSIYSASLYVPPTSWSKPIVGDFFRNFIGLSADQNSLRRCVRLAAYTGSSVPTPLINGTKSGMSFAVECRAEQGGLVSLTVLDQSFQPR